MYRITPYRRVFRLYAPDVADALKFGVLYIALAAKESKVLGTSQIIRRHYTYEVYIMYIDILLRNEKSDRRLPFYPPAVDNSYNTYVPPPNFPRTLYLSSIIRTRTSCLALLCHHTWFDLPSERIREITYDGDIYVIAHSMIRFNQRLLRRHPRIEMFEIVKKTMTSLKQANPSVYQRVRSDIIAFSISRYLERFEYPPDNVIQLFRDMVTNLATLID